MLGEWLHCWNSEAGEGNYGGRFGYCNYSEYQWKEVEANNDELMKELSENLGGEGGGHDGAAGWSGNTDAIAVESAFINILANTRRESN